MAQNFLPDLRGSVSTAILPILGGKVATRVFFSKKGSMRFQDWQHDEAYLLLHYHHRHPHHNEYDNHQHFHLHQVYDEI